jgi:hypothetical protein
MESFLLMELLLPLHLQFEQSFHLLQPIVRIGCWDRACVGFLIILLSQSLLPLRDENPVVSAKRLLAMAGLFWWLGHNVCICAPL